MLKKEKIKLYITGILGTVLLALIIGQVKSPENSKNKAQSTQVSAPFDMESQKISLYKGLEQEISGLNVQRDPFFEAPANLSSEGPKLMGIFWDQEKPMALINNQVLRAGNKVNGCQILEIKKDSILLNDGLKDIEIKIGQSIK